MEQPGGGKIIANGGWIEIRRRGRPKMQCFQTLAVLWFLPSAGALLILGWVGPDWPDAGRFLEYAGALKFEHWIAAGLLLAHPVFAGLAWHYRRTEAEREIVFREPNPDADLHKLRR